MTTGYRLLFQGNTKFQHDALSSYAPTCALLTLPHLRRKSLERRNSVLKTKALRASAVDSFREEQRESCGGCRRKLRGLLLLLLLLLLAAYCHCHRHIPANANVEATATATLTATRIRGLTARTVRRASA